MIDHPLSYLAAQLLQLDKRPALLLLDEHPLELEVLNSLKKLSDLQVISNRYDQVQTLKLNAIDGHFNDFEFFDTTYKLIAFRISKEKEVVHHIIQRAGERLERGGQLILCGYKQEGIKSLVHSAQAYLGGEIKVKRSKNQLRLALIERQNLNREVFPKQSESYALKRPIGIQIGGTPLLSKPGLFSWKAPDRGSELLIALVAELQQESEWIKPDSSLLDLGSGNGYLAMEVLQYRPKEITLTDNCAAAIEVARLNMLNYIELNQLTTDYKVIASDVADTIEKTFDLILCNPPIHQGFQLTPQLTARFIQATRRLLATGGRALFVVNQFIGIEKMALKQSLVWRPLKEVEGYKLGVLSKIKGGSIT